MPRLEHFAYNVADPLKVADWYVRTLGFVVARRDGGPNFRTFLREPESGMMLEFYVNDRAAVPDYATLHPLTLHIAFVTMNPEADRGTLLAAGATCVSDETGDDGSRVQMFRDPFGLALQFCQRSPGFFGA